MGSVGRHLCRPLDRRREVGGAVDVADDARIADRDFHQLFLVRGEQMLGPFISGQFRKILEKGT